MFIKNSGNIEIGSIKILNKDVCNLKGTFTKGSRVKVIGFGERGYDFVDLESGEKAIEVSDVWDGIPVFSEE